MPISRRSLITTALTGACAIALSGCVTTRDGNKTTVALDVDKIKSYGTAGINAANMVIAVISAIPAFSGYTGPIVKALGVLQSTYTAFVGVVGSSVSVSYDDTSHRTLIDSLLDDVKSVLEVVKNAADAAVSAGVVSADLANKLSVVTSALNTIVSIFSVMIGSVISTASGSSAVLTEQQALDILNVH